LAAVTSDRVMRLHVNNHEYAVGDLDGATPLLWVLRDELGLLGSKYGCGIAQCGYCQAGQLMSAAALLRQKPNPTDADIDAAMSGNLCRCGTYPRIRKAIHAAARSAGR